MMTRVTGPRIQDRRPRRRTLRRGPLVALAALGFALGLALAFRGELAAQIRVLGVVGTALDVPVVGPAALRLTDPPRILERTIAGRPTTIYEPRAEGPWPTLVFVNGATPDGRRNPEVRRLAAGLARTGHAVLVPDLPGLATGELSEATASSTVDVARAAADRTSARDGQVGLVGVSVGASLALLAAAQPDLRPRVTVVAGVAPYADLRTVLRVATTGTYEDGGRVRRFQPEPFVRLVMARSLVTALPPGPDRTTLEGAIATAAGGADPLLDPALLTLGPDARALGALLLNRDPNSFDSLYAALPVRVRERVERLSPVRDARRVAAPVELVSPPRDKYFPLSETRALEGALPDARLTITSTLDHADLKPSWSEAGDALALNNAVRRTLEAARP